MKKASSTLLTRLALALLAVLGFVAPLAAPQVDEVVQTAGGKPPPATQQATLCAKSASPATLEVTVVRPTPAFRPSVARGARRYLLNHAWLV